MVRMLRRETWLELGYLLLGGLTSWIAFAVLLAGGVVGGILGLTIVGLPVLVGAFALEREVARLERRRTALLTGPVAELYRPVPARGWLARLRAYAGDMQTWKDILWLILLMPIGFGFAVATASLWASAVYLASSPLWWWAVPRTVGPTSAPTGRSTAGPAPSSSALPGFSRSSSSRGSVPGSRARGRGWRAHCSPPDG